MKNKALMQSEALALQNAHPDWQMTDEGRALFISYRFVNFRRAFAFMSEIGLAAEKFDHHPEWFNVYGRVDIKMTTHDCDGLSVLDEKMVPLISAAAIRFEAKVGQAD